MAKQTSRVSDAQLEQAYQDAIEQFEPNQLVEQRIKAMAHAQVKTKTTDWASFPSWARVASVAGVAVLGWWLFQPTEPTDITARPQVLSMPAPSVNSEKEVEIGVENVSKLIVPQRESQKSKRLSKSAAYSTHSEMLAKVSEGDSRLRVNDDSFQTDEMSPQAPQEASSLQEELAMSALKQEPPAEKCLSQYLNQQTEVQEVEQLPVDITAVQIEKAKLIDWQQKEWKLLRQQNLWYLARLKAQKWEMLLLPEQAVERCFN